MKSRGKPEIVKHEVWLSRFVESCPVMYKGRMLLAVFVEDVPPMVPLPGENSHPHPRCVLADMETRQTVATLAQNFSYPAAYVEGDTMYVFVASTHGPDGKNAKGAFDIHVFWSADLKNWKSKMAVPHAQGEKNINTSVCKGPDGYVMAYETNAYVPFTIRFARSKDLLNWEKVGDLAWRKEKYTACPAIRYHDGYYYMFYLNHTEGRWHFETHLARSKDLDKWEESPLNPVLAPSPEEGCNASDIDMVENGGKVHIVYYTGDQRGSGKLKYATFDGSLGDMLTGFFPA